MRKNYQGKPVKSKGKFEVLGRKEVSVQVSLPLVEVWEGPEPRVEQLSGEAEDADFSGRSGRRGHAARSATAQSRAPASGAVRWGRRPGYVIFSGPKVAVTRPRVWRTREGQEVELDSCARLQHDRTAAARGTRRHRGRAEHRRIASVRSTSVLSGCGIEKSRVDRAVVEQASAARSKEALRGDNFSDLDLVAVLIDGIHFGEQVLVVALGIQTSGERGSGAVARSDGKHHGGEGVAGRPGGARPGNGAALLVRDRRSESVASRDRAGVR